MSRMYHMCDQHRILIFSGASLAVLASVCVAEPTHTLAEQLEEEVNSNREGKGNFKIEIIRLDLRLLKIRLPLVASPIRGHSKTAWTNFDPILTPPPPSSGQAWTSYTPPPLSTWPKGQEKSPPPLHKIILNQYK